MTKTMMAVLAALTVSSAFAADGLEGARAKLAEIRANRAQETHGVTAPAETPAAAPAPAGSPAPKGSPAPAEPIVRGKGYPMKYSGIDMRKPVGPGRPELKTSGSLQYMHATPLGNMPWRVVIDEHAYQVGDIVRGARITKIDDKTVWLTKDGDSWSIPAFME